MDGALPGFERITVNPDKLGCQPCIRSYRFSVGQMLELLADGWTTDEIVTEHPFVGPDDINEALRCAAAVCVL